MKMSLPMKLTGLLLAIVGFVLWGTGDVLAQGTISIQDISVRLDDVEIDQGQKDVSDFSLIEVLFDPAYDLSSSTALRNVQVWADDGDDTIRFNVTSQTGSIRMELKTGEKIRKHCLYKIYIPAGTLEGTQDGQTISNDAVNFFFVTSGDEDDYRHDILQAASPENNAEQVDYTTGKMVLEFIDDIAIDDSVKNNIKDYIAITSERFYDDPSEGNSLISYTEESMDNYDFSIDHNKIILQAKNKVFNNFARYKVELANDTVYLQEPYQATINDSDPVKIYNRAESLNDNSTGFEFCTGQFLSGTDPANNSTGVRVEPVLKFNFNYPVKFNENISSDAITQFITITANGTKSNLDSVNDLNLSPDGKVLTINLHSHRNGNDIPLLKNTYYKVEIESDLLQIINYNLYNPQIQLSFTTTGDGESPAAESYSSDQNGSDDIRFLEHRSQGDKITNLNTDGSIYIKFADQIEADYGHNYPSLPDAVRMYQMPRSEQQTSGGKTEEVESYYLYQDSADQTEEDRIIPGNIPSADINNDLAILEDEAYLEEIPVGTAEIIDSQSLKITPKYKLKNLNKYKLVIDQLAIQDEYGYNLSDDLEVSFWTRAGSTDKNGIWQAPSISTTESGSVIESSSNVYYMSGTPVYGPDLPLVLNVDGDVIPRIRDEVLSTGGEQDNCRINYDSLKQISLTDTYNVDSDDQQVKIGRFEIYHSQDLSSTRILLYPLTSLGYGKEYCLTVPTGVLETRDGNTLEKLEFNLVVEADPLNPENVYQLENNTVKVTDIWKQSYWNLKIKGGNLRGDITDVRLTPVSGPALSLTEDKVPIIINQDDLELNSSTELTVKIRADNAAKLAQEQYTGQYSVTINFADGTTVVLGEGSTLEPDQQLAKLYFTVLSKGKPQVLGYYPNSSDSSTCYDENAMPHDIQDSVTADRQFIKITFEDIDGKLELVSRSDLQKTSVTATGDNNSLVDTSFIDQTTIDPYLLRKDRTKGEAYLYIPIAKMKSQTSYHVTIPAGVVKNDSSEEFNDSLSWSINTIAVPSIYDKKTPVQSVAENYDPQQPIILKGENFGTAVKVYFNDIAADKVKVQTNGNEQYLRVYLPDSRLTPGLYDITIENDENHTTTIYGVLSIVAAGDNVPRAGQRVRNSENQSMGEVIETISTSEDTLELKAKYRDRNKVELDLDDLMGKDALVRKIKFEADRHDRIGQLITLSCWADITLYNVGCEDDDDEQDVEIRLGRIPASLSRTLKAKLTQGIKSDLIEADGDNLKVDRVDLNIPYRQSDGKNIKVLRYDPKLRSWFEVPFVIDYVDQTVSVNNTQPGIFVVVGQ